MYPTGQSNFKHMLPPTMGLFDLIAARLPTAE